MKEIGNRLWKTSTYLVHWVYNLHRPSLPDFQIYTCRSQSLPQPHLWCVNCPGQLLWNDCPSHWKYMRTQICIKGNIFISVSKQYCRVPPPQGLQVTVAWGHGWKAPKCAGTACWLKPLTYWVTKNKPNRILVGTWILLPSYLPN